jgi:hypothetical protein
MTRIDEIHLPFRVDDNRSARMRGGRVASQATEEADDGERQ